MAAVFLMQPLGQLSATLVGYGVINGLCHQYNITTETDHMIIAPVIDIAWRIVIGVGALPALLAVIARMTIPESPRFILDVEENEDEAVETLYRRKYLRSDLEECADGSPRDREAGNLLSTSGHTVNGQGAVSSPESAPDQRRQGDNSAPSREDSIPMEHSSAGQQGSTQPPVEEQAQVEEQAPVEAANNQRRALSRRASLVPYVVPKSGWRYFIEDGNWRYLAGISLAWLTLDFVFYGLGIDNPQTIAKIWADHIPPAQNSTSPPLHFWQDPYNPNNTIYQVLQDNAVQSMITISIGSMLGSLLFVFFIDYIPRRLYLSISFGVLTGLFAIVGSTFLTSTFGNSLHGVTISMYVLCQLFFNFGKSNHASALNQK